MRNGSRRADVAVLPKERAVFLEQAVADDLKAVAVNREGVAFVEPVDCGVAACDGDGYRVGGVVRPGEGMLSRHDGLICRGHEQARRLVNDCGVGADTCAVGRINYREVARGLIDAQRRTGLHAADIHAREVGGNCDGRGIYADCVGRIPRGVVGGFGDSVTRAAPFQRAVASLLVVAQDNPGTGGRGLRRRHEQIARRDVNGVRPVGARRQI